MAPDRTDGGLSVARPAVEIIAIGDELLLGDTVDTNGAWLGNALSGAGIRVVRRTVVGDDDDAIHAAVTEALTRTGAIICCGGLGPTPDDRTRAVVASVYGWPLEIDEAWVETMRARFTARGFAMAETNLVQANVPRGATVFRNAIGTAPGLGLADEAHGITILLPGVPREMRWLFEEHALDWLRSRIARTGRPIRRRILRTMGVAESTLAERIADIAGDMSPLTLAFLPTGTGIDLRLTSWGDADDAIVSARFEEIERALRERLGRAIYGDERADLAMVVGDALREHGMTIAVAESCTGGLLAKRLTDAAGSSDFMIGAVVSYANEAKIELLGVPAATIERFGAVSEETAAAMLDGVLSRTGADCAISITGIAGPGGGTEEKPVGTVWTGVAAGEARRVRRLALFGDRAEIRERSVQAALKILLDMLSDR
jgi:nicotinamide-nucleotide amidase